MNQSVPPIPVPDAPVLDSPVPMLFAGLRGDFFRLVMRGALLEFVTVGFYRFWLVTDMRRHLWSHTVVDGDAPEYVGRGRELLIGFLVAMAILAPIYLAYFLVGLEAERIQAFASFPLFAFLYIFGQFAIYRARRYRLSRTVWRGVRFWMSGSGWAYAFRAALWSILMLLTLGLVLPWRDAALERYKMRHSFYGDLQGSFEGTGWEFFKRGWWLWPLAFVSVILLPLAPTVYAAFKALQWRWWLSGVRFGGVQFESDLRSGVLAKLYWKMIAWALLLVVGLIVYITVAVVLVGTMNGLTAAQAYKSPAFLQSIPFAIATVLGYLAAMLSFNVIFRLYLTRDFWTHVAASIRIRGLAATSNVAAKGDLAGALGEGFADGLDVGGF